MLYSAEKYNNYICYAPLYDIGASRGNSTLVFAVMLQFAETHLAWPGAQLEGGRCVGFRV